MPTPEPSSLTEPLRHPHPAADRGRRADPQHLDRERGQEDQAEAEQQDGRKSAKNQSLHIPPPTLVDSSYLCIIIRS